MDEFILSTASSSRYKSPPNASVQHALRQYQQGFQGSKHSKAYCAAPLPPYLEEEGTGSGEKIFDTAYHLMCLYADKTYSLEALLLPTSSAASHLDFRLRWVIDITPPPPPPPPQNYRSFFFQRRLSSTIALFMYFYSYAVSQKVAKINMQRNYLITAALPILYT